MKKILVVLSFLFLLSSLSQSIPVLSFQCLGIGPDSLHAEEKQKTQQPSDWKSLSPETQKFIMGLGEEELRQEKDALQNALNWLELVDEGKYKEACDTVSDLMLAIAMGDNNEIEECGNRLKHTRKTLGRLVSRQSLSAKAMSYDQTGPEVVFSTVFKKKTVKEIIILNPVGYGVDQYYIQQRKGNPQLVIPKP